MTQRPRPYRVTPLFDADSVPAGLQRTHRTKPGVWGELRVMTGSVRFVDEAGENAAAPMMLTAPATHLILPARPHRLELVGPVTLCVAFFDTDPNRTEAG